MKSLPEKAVDYARARHALLSWRTKKKRLKCTECGKHEWPHQTCELVIGLPKEKWCHNCQERLKLLEGRYLLASSARLSWARLRYSLAKEDVA